MPILIDGSPISNPIPGPIYIIHSFKASSPFDPSIVKISTSPHASLGFRPINPPNRYGDWHYSFIDMANTLPLVSRTYDEAINSIHAKEWKAAMNAKFDALTANDTSYMETLTSTSRVIQSNVNGFMHIRLSLMAA